MYIYFCTCRRIISSSEIPLIGPLMSVAAQAQTDPHEVKPTRVSGSHNVHDSRHPTLLPPLFRHYQTKITMKTKNYFQNNVNLTWQGWRQKNNGIVWIGRDWIALNSPIAIFPILHETICVPSFPFLARFGSVNKGRPNARCRNFPEPCYSFCKWNEEGACIII